MPTPLYATGSALHVHRDTKVALNGVRQLCTLLSPMILNGTDYPNIETNPKYSLDPNIINPNNNLDKDAMNQMIKDNRINRAELEKERIKASALIESFVDPCDPMLDLPEWIAARATNDFLQLIKIAKAESWGPDRDKIALQMFNRLTTFDAKPHESLNQINTRFKNDLCEWRITESVPPGPLAERALSAHYATNILGPAYEQTKPALYAALKNNTRIEDMMKLASETALFFNIDICTSPPDRQASVLVATRPQNNQRFDSKKNAIPTCGKCQKKGHIRGQCPEQDCNICKGHHAQFHTTATHRGPSRLTPSPTPQTTTTPKAYTVQDDTQHEAMWPRGLTARTSRWEDLETAQHAWDAAAHAKHADFGRTHALHSMKRDIHAPRTSWITLNRSSIIPQSIPINKADIRQAAGDGNCLYRSFSGELTANVMHKQFRSLAAGSLRSHDQTQIPQLDMTLSAYATFEDAEKDQPPRPLEDRLASILNGQHGGVTELIALELAMQYGAIVYVQDGNEFRLIFAPGPNTSIGKAICLKVNAKEQYNHYDELLIDRVFLESFQTPPTVNPSTPQLRSALLAGEQNAHVAISGNRTIVIDSGASSNIYTSAMPLTQLTPLTTTINTLAATVVATESGTHHIFGRGLVIHAAQESLISLQRLTLTHTVTFNQNNQSFEAVPKNPTDTLTLIFAQNEGGLYALQDPDIALSPPPAINVARTPVETPGTRAAQRLHCALHHPGTDALAAAIQSGSIIGTQCNVSDLHDARTLSGPCLACLAGKTTQDPSPASTTAPPALGTTLHVDLMFILREPYALAVEGTSSVALIYKLSNRTAQALGDAILSFANEFNFHTKTKVTHVRVDPERGFIGATAMLLEKGIRLVIVPAERHVRIAERKIRELKEKMRSTISALKYKLPAKLYGYLLIDVALASNLVSHNRNALSPRQTITGQPTNVGIDFEHAFGDIGTTRVMGSAKKDDMHARGELAVVVGHYIGEAGALMLWMPASGKVAKRNSLNPVKLTEEIINLIHARCEHDSTFDNNDIIDNVSRFRLQPPPVPVADAPDANATIDSDSDDVDQIQEPATNSTLTPDTTTTPATPLPTDYLEPTLVVQEATHTRLGRIINKPHRYKNTSGMTATHTLPSDNTTTTPAPTDGTFTIKQAIALDPARAKVAARAEISQMLQLKVFDKPDVHIAQPPLPCKLFFKYKLANDILIMKARLVIAGNRQDPDTIGEVYSSTVNPESVNVTIAIAAYNKRPLYTIDVSGAFLHVDLAGSPVHMRLPQTVAEILVDLDPTFNAYARPDGSLVVRIKKAIYGLGESSRQWNEHLGQTLALAGYERLQYDRSMFVKHRTNKVVSILCVHVDDILGVDLEGDHYRELTAALIAQYKKITTNQNSELTYLGVSITQTPGTVRMHQRPLINAIAYPSPTKKISNAASAELLEGGDSSPASHPDLFRSTLMRILYIACKTRFDVLFVTNVLATRQQHCTKGDEASLAQLAQHLRQTASWDYVISPTDAILRTSADASHATHPDGFGHSGIACTIGGSTVFACSKKQGLIAKSSSESELLALNSAMDETIYLRNVLAEIGQLQFKPTQIDQDNKSAIIMAERGELGSKRTKHFTVRHYFITTHLQQGLAKLMYHPGASILADGLTKPTHGPHARTWAQALLQGNAYKPP